MRTIRRLRWKVPENQKQDIKNAFDGLHDPTWEVKSFQKFKKGQVIQLSHHFWTRNFKVEFVVVGITIQKTKYNSKIIFYEVETLFNEKEEINESILKNGN